MLVEVATEIERKWVVTTVPEDVDLGPGTPLRQGYLCRDGAVEVRLRRQPRSSTLTLKAGSGLTRVEIERELDEAEADALWVHTVGRRLEKTRHRVEVGDITADVDLYAGPLEGLCVVEVEFTSEDAASSFDAPAWFGREVTGDRRWSNAALADDGMPK